MEKATGFKSNRSEAWDSWFDGQSVTADFMSERENRTEARGVSPSVSLVVRLAISPSSKPNPERAACGMLF
ncbi:MAG: hypothetical protein ACTIJ4_10150 [Halomonas sp.]|uniref:hypothetical protein n=1 Tax=Halomonas sp. TaxID=1486246 RepID=UPI0039F317F7